MNARLAARISGTKAQHDAFAIQALATKIIALKRDTRLNATERLQLIRSIATR